MTEPSLSARQISAAAPQSSEATSSYNSKMPGNQLRFRSRVGKQEMKGGHKGIGEIVSGFNIKIGADEYQLLRSAKDGEPTTTQQGFIFATAT